MATTSRGVPLSEYIWTAQLSTSLSGGFDMKQNRQEYSGEKNLHIGQLDIRQGGGEGGDVLTPSTSCRAVRKKQEIAIFSPKCIIGCIVFKMISLLVFFVNHVLTSASVNVFSRNMRL